MLTDRRASFDTVHATAQEEAYQHIKRGIRTGELRPGMRLAPDDIAAEIGTSRMPVREALNRLATEGLIVNRPDRKSTRLNSSHSQISYAVFCLKKKKATHRPTRQTRPLIDTGDHTTSTDALCSHQEREQALTRPVTPQSTTHHHTKYTPAHQLT